ALALGRVRQTGGKVVHVWAVRGDLDPSRLRSNRFELEWPPRSGQMRSFPEVDAASWFDLAEARRRILPTQAAFLDALVAALPGGVRWAAPALAGAKRRRHLPNAPKRPRSGWLVMMEPRFLSAARATPRIR